MGFYWRKKVLANISNFVCRQDLSQCVTCKEKHITVKKEPHESLGMTVAGGRGSKSGELPIFVTSVQPHGCLSRDGRIKRGERLFWNVNCRTSWVSHWCVFSPPISGDVLLSINGQDLTYLSHGEAVGTLKASAASPSVQLRVLEVSMVEEHDHDKLLPHTHDSDFDANWSPSWVMWLGLPRWAHRGQKINYNMNLLLRRGAKTWSLNPECVAFNSYNSFFLNCGLLFTILLSVSLPSPASLCSLPAATCTVAMRLFCGEATLAAGASASLGDTRKVTATRHSLSKPSSSAHLHTMMAASSEWLMFFSWLSVAYIISDIVVNYRSR